MRGTPTDFWGKLDLDSQQAVVGWHPLPDHCADVAAVAEALLSLPVWGDRLGRLAGRPLTRQDVARLSVLAALHDIGKFGLGFQAKGRPDLGSTAGHVAEAVAAVDHGAFGCLEELGDWGESAAPLLVSAICHHGAPHSVRHATATAWRASWWRPRCGLDPAEGVSALLNRCRAWFPDAFDASPNHALPDAVGFGHAFAGLVMLADWIGSDKSRFFPFSEPGDCDRMPMARAQARTATNDLALDVPLVRRASPLRSSAFARVSSHPPTPAQSLLANLPATPEPSITILEAETGSGKTEAALARFVSLFEAGLVDGLYFALPTRSAATEMHTRVVDAVTRAFTHPPVVVLAVPGYLRVDGVDGRWLPPFDVQWPDTDRYRYRAWAAEGPKRFLAGCIAVGTIDQVLLSSLMVRHAHLRATSLLRHLLVVDEVHASDAYMTRILRDVLGRHHRAGGHALLLSATLSGEARTQLIAPEVSPPSLTLAQAVGLPYPLVTHRVDRISESVAPHGGQHRSVSVEARPWMDDPQASASAALAAARRGAKVLVVRNTVADCVDTQLALERQAAEPADGTLPFRCQGVAAPHHSRFAREDRMALDGALQHRFGRVRDAGGCVVVATQTVQQSLDLDADLLITDLCPTDVFLQRIGRLHRHIRPRPGGFETARAVVAVPDQRDLGSLIDARGVVRARHGIGSVYADMRILEAMWRLVERYSVWEIPSMNRLLVESGLHSTVLESIARDGGECWQAHEAEMVGRVLGHARLAKLNLVDWSQPYDDTSFDIALDRRISTRLGEDDRLVRFDPRPMGPFGAPLDELRLRGWWAAGLSDDAQPQDVTSHGGQVRFVFGRRQFVYDRLGLRPDDTPPGEAAHDDAP